MPSFRIPQFPKTNGDTTDAEVAAMCSDILDEPATIAELETWAVEALKGGTRKARCGALARAYYVRLASARLTAMDSPATTHLPRQVAETLAFTKVEFGMPFEARRELLDALGAVRRKKRDLEIEAHVANNSSPQRSNPKHAAARAKRRNGQVSGQRLRAKEARSRSKGKGKARSKA